jgi:hypothetical protein
LYIDGIISNPGGPTNVHGWALEISLPNKGGTHLFTPRWLSAGMPFMNVWGAPTRNDFSERPLEPGARLQCRVGFTIEGIPPGQRFGITGTSFHLSAMDVRGNRFGDVHVLTEGRQPKGPPAAPPPIPAPPAPPGRT